MAKPEAVGLGEREVLVLAFPTLLDEKSKVRVVELIQEAIKKITKILISIRQISKQKKNINFS
jgi:hypothetical protein